MCLLDAVALTSSGHKHKRASLSLGSDHAVFCSEHVAFVLVAVFPSAVVSMEHSVNPLRCERAKLSLGLGEMRQAHTATA